MIRTYSDCNVISLRFPQEQLAAVNELAIGLGLPRNTIIRKAFAMILADVKAGRKLFDLEQGFNEV